ncbi:MAG: hypothetical protein WA384_07580 [Rhodomicrobium sp.]
MSEVICAGVFPREVVIDTETTGLDARAGHRVVEIGCGVTGAIWHCYFNPGA